MVKASKYRRQRLCKVVRGYEETTNAQTGKRPQDIDGIETMIVTMKETSN